VGDLPQSSQDERAGICCPVLSTVWKFVRVAVLGGRLTLTIGTRVRALQGGCVALFCQLPGHGFLCL
jgi:hypothetical protein